MYLVLLLVMSSFCCRCTVSKELHFHCEKDLVTHVPGFCSHLHSSLWQARQCRSCMCLAVTIFCRTRLNFNRTFCRSKFLHQSSLQMPMQISADIPGWRLSGNLRHCRKETSSVRSHWDAICTQQNDHTGDEKFRGCWPSHLEQFTSHSANCNSLPFDIRSTFEGPPVWLIGSASEDYLWRALQIPSSSSSSSYLLWLLRLNMLLLVWHLEEHNMAVEYSTPVILQKVSLEIFEDIA